MAAWKIVTVVRKFNSPAGVPKEELSCGHVQTDKDWTYENETAVAIRAMAGGERKRRCYTCAEKPPDPKPVEVRIDITDASETGGVECYSVDCPNCLSILDVEANQTRILKCPIIGRQIGRCGQIIRAVKR